MIDLFEKILNEMEKFFFLGTCKNIVDPEDTEAVSALAGIVEEGKKITKEEFSILSTIWDEHLKMLNLNLNNFEFYHNQEWSIAWFYDKKKDIEYFYGLGMPNL